jgi:hypothetical protein
MFFDGRLQRYKWDNGIWNTRWRRVLNIQNRVGDGGSRSSYYDKCDERIVP